MRIATWNVNSLKARLPRVEEWLADVLDRIDQFPDFNPRVDYRLTVTDSELTEVERNARAASTVDDIDLDV